MTDLRYERQLMNVREQRNLTKEKGCAENYEQEEDERLIARKEKSKG